MEWRKLKNLIILILLVVNGFLLVLVGSRREESVRYERRALDQTVQVLRRGSIEVDQEALESGEGLSPMSVERDLGQEARLAQSLLEEEIQGDNRGGGLYRYRGALGEVSFRAGGELSAEFAADDHWNAERPERHAAALLERLGLEGRLETVQEQGRTVVRFRQNWNGAEVFTSHVEFVYREGRLCSLSGVLLLGPPGAAEPGEVLTLPTALMRFSEEVAGTGDVCSAVRAMEAGYRGTAQTLSGGTRLAPVWLVTTDTTTYYLDGVTGTLTRAQAAQS